MPPDIERLETKLDFVLAQISGLGTDVAVLKQKQQDDSEANGRQHLVISKSISELVEQEKIRNGRLGKVEDSVSGLKMWRNWATGVVFGAGAFILVFAKLLWEHISGSH